LFIRHELLPALPSVFVVFTILIIMGHLNLLLAAISLIIIPAVVYPQEPKWSLKNFCDFLNHTIWFPYIKNNKTIGVYLTRWS